MAGLAGFVSTPNAVRDCGQHCNVCSTNDAVDDIFSYAREKGIEVIVPANALKERNIARREERHAKQ